jgi:hypothetical protein
MRKGSRSKKKRITRGDVFVEKATRQMVRVMAASKARKNFGGVLGTIIVRPLDEDGEWLTLRTGNDMDQTISERDYAFVRPSNMSVIRGDLKKAGGLTIGVDVDRAPSLLAMQKEPVDMHQDVDGQDNSSLEGLMNGLPMFAGELPLVEQVMANHGNTIESSPIVHPEIAGRGVEHAHGRAAWKCSSQCKRVLGDMKLLVLCACNVRTQPQSLMAKCERRTRDHMRSCRMGTSSMAGSGM